MKNALWIAAIVLAFIAGYFTHGTNQETTVTTPSAQTLATNIQENSGVSKDQLAATAKTIFAVKEKSDPQHNPSNNTTDTASTQKSPDDSAPSSEAEKTPENKYPNEISDDDIDKHVPAPFNNSLKHHHGALREKFKEYANAASPNDWDVRMQNKITDFVLSNPYAKNISVEFIGCKAELCELRIYENKKGVWNHIMSEMALQDWWDIGGYSASGNTVNQDNPDVSAWHILLPKK